MKALFILFLVIIARVGFSQELVSVNKVTKDTIAIKWLPSTYDQLVKISKGATVSRAVSEKPINFQLVNFTNAKTWSIDPLDSRYKGLGTSNEDEKFRTLLEPVIEGSSDKEQANFVVMTNVIENMVNPRFQSILGNALFDTDFDRSKTYVYKIEVEGLDPIYSFVNPKERTNYLNIKVSLLLDRKKTVTVEWDSKIVADQSLGFFVEHAIDEPIKGSYLDDLPYIPFSTQFEVEDKISTVIDEPLEGHFHYYRVHGLDPFGEPSLHSKWEKIYVPLRVHAVPYIDTIRAKESERIIEVSASLLKPNPNVKSWALLRSESRDQGYATVGTYPYSDSTESFTLNGKPSGDHFYYKIQLINKDDTVTSMPYYFFTLDQEPPEPPNELNGTINENGLVSINWSAPLDDDIQGYRVFRGNHKREEFIEKTTELYNVLSFSDTLALDNLTSEVYYFVQTVDMNFNNSVPSDTILVLKPDTIPPMAPAMKSIKVKDTALMVSWVNSKSSDLQRTVLIRNEIDTISLTQDQTSYMDYIIEAGNHYSYQLICEDEQAN
ncbi:MAG: hypothetical protein P8P74_06960, partial [Crocinitomicaceae bacterium]|nr:hypothetical protein [Crocinitomicaceae bacterium]